MMISLLRCGDDVDICVSLILPVVGYRCEGLTRANTTPEDLPITESVSSILLMRVQFYFT